MFFSFFFFYEFLRSGFDFTKKLYMHMYRMIYIFSSGEKKINRFDKLGDKKDRDEASSCKLRVRRLMEKEEKLVRKRGGERIKSSRDDDRGSRTRKRKHSSLDNFVVWSRAFESATAKLIAKKRVSGRWRGNRNKRWKTKKKRQDHYPGKYRVVVIFRSLALDDPEIRLVISRGIRDRLAI